MRQNSSKGLLNQCLREARVACRWSQKEVADRIGTTTNNVSRWELGQTIPGPYFRAKLCALFGKSAEELGWEKPVSQPPIASEAPLEGTEPTHAPHAEESLMLWSVPYTRNPHFTGRDELLEQLAQHLSPIEIGELKTTRCAALTQMQAIKGLGGVGKTQIAVEYAYRAREQERYTHTIWINAANEEAVMSSFVTLAEQLPDFPTKSETDQRKLVAAITCWLEQCPQPWLLIFDNADDLALIQHYFPHQGNGSILLTTRAHAVGALAIALEVEKMGLMEGTHFLLRRTQRQCASDEEINEATNIVIALDGFPLALDQAGAYIEETECSFEEYLQLYQQHCQTLLARRGKQNTNYPDSVATTWSLSFQKVEQANPAAAELLQLCAFLAPDHIPEELLKEGAAHWPPLLQQAAADLLAFNCMLEELLKFSLVKRLMEGRFLSIHRLVQVVLKDAIEEESQRQWAERVIRAVNAAFPPAPKTEVATWPRCLRYLEQAQACDALIQQYQILLPEAAELLDRTAIYLREHASYTLAESLYDRALQIRERLLHQEQAHMAHLLNEMAILYHRQGKYEQAESQFQRVVQLREQTLGPDHAEVADALNGLANLYREQGKYAQAESLSQRALHIYEQSSASDDAHIASLLQGLANIYLDQGKFSQAEPLLQRALYMRETALGPDHSDVALSFGQLAKLFTQQGKYLEAEPLYLRALDVLAQIVDHEHPYLAPLLNNLANLYQSQGRYEEAEPLYLRTLRIGEQALGADHPNLGHPLNNLANLYYEQRRYEEAEPLYLRAARIWEQALGPEHDLVAHPLNNLANLYRELGKYEQAEPLYLRTLRIWEALGPDSAHVAYALNGLANLYRELGKYEQAEPLYQRALRIRKQSLGEQHIETAEILHDFAALQEAEGKQSEAISSYQQALAIREQVLGAQNSKTIETRERLHAVLQAMGGMEEAQSTW